MVAAYPMGKRGEVYIWFDLLRSDLRDPLKQGMVGSNYYSELFGIYIRNLPLILLSCLCEIQT